LTFSSIAPATRSASGTTQAMSGEFGDEGKLGAWQVRTSTTTFSRVPNACWQASAPLVGPTLVVEALAVTAEGRGREDLLWPNTSGGYLHPQRVGGWLSKAVGRCQQEDPTFPRITAHDLRHTAASLAISAGANVKVVQRMLGHASAATTLDIYADLFESDLDSVAENVSKLWPQEAKKDTSTS
jgi:Phage integrase family